MKEEKAGFELPVAPASLAGPVKAWSQAVVIPTYLPMQADKNPMFLEKRVYQGSSGKVYPLPFIDRISDEKRPHRWEAVHIENEFIRVMILPELGGRIHVALDKTNGYDFVYRQNVIKPALVGLAGPWISGGIEFNWPQHHRPSTFMPAEVVIEEHEDGSRTVWLSEHEPMNRMKGMHGVCIHPEKSFIELKVRLYNRTPLVQSFLWWANVAARVHEKYQSFFPPDVYYVADHARRAMSRFPKCEGLYYGVDYGGRTSGNDLSWYANIPVPTSYMCMGSKEDFFGGYDHAAEAGIVHYASHHIAPGKKQWTWGNHEFGYAWDRNLTDADGPYIEIMAGVYTDNQPDFSFLHPYETRTFSQYWYPIQRIGPAHRANRDAAVSLNVINGEARVGVAVSGVFAGATVTLEQAGKELARWAADLSPGEPLVKSVAVEDGQGLRIVVRRGDGSVLIEYQAAEQVNGEVPAAAAEPGLPEEIETEEELFLTGLHLEQYRHATRSPTDYWQEALRRNPADARCNNALGLWRMRRGEFAAAEGHFRRGVQTLTERNPNPYDGELHYNLGLALRWLGRDEEAYAAFYKATWNYSWQSAAFYALAEIDCRRGEWESALEHLDRSLRVNVEHLKARNLQAMVLEKIGRSNERLLAGTLAIDPLDWWARSLQGQEIVNEQIALDVALDFAAAGFYAQAIKTLTLSLSRITGRGDQRESGSGPLTHYGLGYFHQLAGMPFAEHFARGAAASPDYCFPSRLEEIVILQAAMEANPRDSKAPYYLGNLYYDRRRHREAVALWEKSVELDGGFSIAWRNLGIGYHNVLHDPVKARAAYDRAVEAAPNDARLLYERDQLWKRLGESPQRRLAELETRIRLVARRDDLSVELAALFNQTGQHECAAGVLMGRRFQPWEGGEGLALGQHVRMHLAMGRAALSAGDGATALRHFQAAADCPENLGEARHLLANRSDIDYWLGEACGKMQDVDAAQRHWLAAADFAGDFQEMSVKSFSELTYYRALALRRLDRGGDADVLLQQLLAYAKTLETTAAKIDYFATSLPTMLIFEEDIQRRQEITVVFLMAQAYLGLGNRLKGRELLERVLEMDQNHALAADLMAGGV